MKRILCIVSLSLTFLFVKAQDLPNFRYIRIVDASDF